MEGADKRPALFARCRGTIDVIEVAAAYGPNQARLRALEAKYDPTNAFHLNLNVQPGLTGAAGVRRVRDGQQRGEESQMARSN